MRGSRQVEEIVPVGALDPNNIHVPGAFVHRVVQGPKYEKRIEVRRSAQAPFRSSPRRG